MNLRGKLSPGEIFAIFAIFADFGQFATVWSAKNVFEKIREKLSYVNWNSKTNLMKIETDLLEYA